MKYFSLDSVISAFKSNKNKTSDGFWGIMAILLSLDSEIVSCKQYSLDCGKISTILERWFSVRTPLKTYNTAATWYVVFSSVWKEQLTLFMKVNPRPNIYDVICWMYQDTPFNNNPTDEELLALFCHDTSLDMTTLESLFDFTKRDYVFSDSLFSHEAKIEGLQKLYGAIGDNKAIKCNGTYIVADAGAFQRAPFTQTLYAGVENFKCLIFTSSEPDVFYPTNFNNNPLCGLPDEHLQIIYYGAPGTGKSHKIDNDPRVTDENTIRITFHPDSDYSTFVGAYKPTMASMPVNAFVGTTVHHAKNAYDEKAYEKKIAYKYVPQAFLKAYVDAWSDLDNPHFLVIEEINRGNCAQIFGDLFQLLDRNNRGSSSYAIHADEDISQFLAEDDKGFAKLSEDQKDAIRTYILVKDSGKTETIGEAILSGKKLLLPPNLYIWATMNTSDQSLFPIDSAFKRRWNWEYIPIDYDAKDWQFEVGGKRYLWSDFLKKINPLIYKLTQSSDKQMGYFFAKADKKTDASQVENNLISEKIFLNKVLFYLWTDVLKDFEEGNKIFQDEEKGEMYQFSDFFPTTNGKLAEFVGKLELPVVELAEGNNDEVDFDSPNDSDLNDHKSIVQRDYSKYSVNGQGRMSKSDAVVAAMTAFVEAFPALSAAEILRKIEELNLPYTIAYSEEDFNRYLNQSTDPRFAKRYARIETGTGEHVYVYKGSTPQSIGELIHGLNNSGSGIILAKVE